MCVNLCVCSFNDLIYSIPYVFKELKPTMARRHRTLNRRSIHNVHKNLLNINLYILFENTKNKFIQNKGRIEETI